MKALKHFETLRKRCHSPTLPSLWDNCFTCVSFWHHNLPAVDLCPCSALMTLIYNFFQQTYRKLPPYKKALIYSLIIYMALLLAKNKTGYFHIRHEFYIYCWRECNEVIIHHLKTQNDNVIRRKSPYCWDMENILQPKLFGSSETTK
jgi:hypothetical protein